MKTRSKVLFGIVAFLANFLFFGTISGHADSRKVIDISEWQGRITATQAKRLKSEVQGIILRVQYGSAYADKVFRANASTLNRAGVPFGVYSYSMYTSSADAKSEARVLFNRAKAYKPAFYANDAEQYTTTSGSYRAAVKAWGTQMQALTSKPVVLYSGSSFYRSYIGTTAKYDKFWEANYGASRWYSSDWWQYTDHYYSTSLRKGVDGNRIMKGTIFKTNASKFTVGGRKVGEQVRVTKGAKFYGTSATIAKSMIKKNLTIKQVKAAHIGKSKQVVLVYNGKTPIGWLRAQDVTAYYHASYVKKLKVKNSKGIYTYLHGKRAHFYKKGKVLKLSHFKKNGNGLWRAVHSGHTTTFTANKDFVKWVK
ncbi:GH25 family lysozyme [Levilactobacillus namurensis]|uniref:GH25 family lysozyme n=1 Tax=Levilactobacillus namurensis TaxID=380393 RepID=UPI0026EE6F44|nr:GH25 family lysozyme [Levilactobacillus namurensis]